MVFDSLSVVPLVLTVLLFMKFHRKYSWLARIPVAFIVAAYAGVKLTGEARAAFDRRAAAGVTAVLNELDGKGLLASKVVDAMKN